MQQKKTSIQRHRVVVIGGGFGGLQAVLGLRHTDVDITLIDKRNFHLFQPLLYQVATGSLSPSNIAEPLRSIFKRQKNTTVLMGEVTNIDLKQQQVILENGQNIRFDSLVVAAGASHSYFGHAQWQTHAPGLKTIEDATRIRKHIFEAFEKAERCSDPQEQQRLMTFVVVGGGPTGVELAGALAEVAKQTLKNNFRRIDPSQAKIYLLEAGPQILAVYPKKLSDKAQKALNALGVMVKVGAIVQKVEKNSVYFIENGVTRDLDCQNILWAAGVEASSLATKLSEQSAVIQDRSGRLKVEADFSLKNFPNVFVIGDMAAATYKGKLLAGVAPAAMQAGAYVARVIAAALKGKKQPIFHYTDYGNMAIIGRFQAVVDSNGIRFSGFVAWLAWLLIHLIKLEGFHNRLLVLMQWLWHYFSSERSARLINDDNLHEKETHLP